MKVLVTGATGRTGKDIVKLLLKENVPVRALVRSVEKAKKEIFSEEDLAHLELVQGDIRDKSSIAKAFEGCSVVVITTSSMIQMRTTGTEKEFYYNEGSFPEDVDYKGQKTQIDLAKEAGASYIVLISSMGITKPDHRLNKMGNGNVLVWKGKAEEYLRSSGIDYVIVRPGGLTDNKGGNAKLVVSQDHDAKLGGLVTREDLASVCTELILNRVQNKGHNYKSNITFDLVSEKEGQPINNQQLLSSL